MEEKNNNEKYWNAEKSNGFDSKQNWILQFYSSMTSEAHHF